MISYGISLSLSDLLCLVWWSLGPSMLLQMALFHSFYDWVIFRCTYLLYSVIYQWTFRLLPCLGYRKWCCYEQRTNPMFQWSLHYAFLINRLSFNDLLRISGFPIGFLHHASATALGEVWDWGFGTKKTGLLRQLCVSPNPTNNSLIYNFTILLFIHKENTWISTWWEKEKSKVAICFSASRV